MSKISEWLIRHTTNIDPHSLTPFEETVIEGLILIIIILAIISVTAGRKPTVNMEVEIIDRDGFIIESKDAHFIVGYQPKISTVILKDQPRKE